MNVTKPLLNPKEQTAHTHTTGYAVILLPLHFKEKIFLPLFEFFIIYVASLPTKPPKRKE
jgi:hypothetical protein